MATGIDLSRSTDKASEEFFENRCSPCSAEGENSEAVKYCADCFENFCIKCLKDHNKFAAMRSHNIMDMSEVARHGKPSAKYIPTERCDTHHGSLIDTYCGNHDVVCCPTCVAVNHRSCVDITYVLDAAEGFLETKYKNVEKDLEKLQGRLSQLKKGKHNELQTLERETATCLTEISDFRKKLNKTLDELEEVARIKVHTKHKKYKQKLDTDIQVLEQMLTKLDESINKLKKINANNEPQVFVNVKIGKKNEMDGNKVAEEIQTNPTHQPLVFKKNTALDEFLKRTKSLDDETDCENVPLAKTEVLIPPRPPKVITKRAPPAVSKVMSTCKENNDFVDSLVKEGNIKSPLVEWAFRSVDRAQYHLPDHRDTAYKIQPWKQGHLHLSAPNIYSAVMEALNLKPGLSFLNLGSGTGYLNTMIGLILGPTGRNLGVELHKDAVQYAQARLEEFKKTNSSCSDFEFCEPKFIEGNCLKMNYGSNLYDRVYVGAACPPEYENYVKNLVKIDGMLVMPLNNKLIQATRVKDRFWDTNNLMGVSFATLVLPQP